MLFIALHFEDLCPQLVDDYLLLVQFLLELLHTLHLFNGIVRSFSFFLNLRFVSLLHLLLLFFLGGDDDFVARYFLFRLRDLILCNDQLPFGLSFVLLQRADMCLKLDDDVSELLVFLLELALQCFHANLIDMVLLRCNFLQLRRVKSVIILLLY